MTQENRTQDTPTPMQDSGELTATELARVVGGGDGGPGSPGDDTSVQLKASPILF